MKSDEIENELSEGAEGLPEGWVEADLDLLAAPKKHALKAGPFGSALKKSMYVAAGYKIYGQEQVINSDETIGNYYINAEKYNELSACAVSPGDILVSLVGTAGKVLVLSERAEAGIINPRLIKLSLHEEIYRRYISLFVKSPVAQSYFKAQGHGGTMEILNLGILRKLPIPLPPLPEQIRIADKLDALLARVDAGRERLERVPKLVKQFRQSVLSAAVSGELTREWRGGGDAEWGEGRFTDYFDVQGGTQPPKATFINEPKEGYIRLLQIRDFGERPVPTYIPFAKSLKICNEEDILIGRYGASVGRICTGMTGAYNVALTKVVALRPKEHNSRFTYFLLLSPGFYEAINGFQRSAQDGFNKEDLKQIAVLMPPLPEQAEIVHRVEALFAIADRLEQRYQMALTSFQRLTPALLAKAFRGELVPQDPNDEPASVLLERIRAQRAQGGRQKAEGGKVRAADGDGAEPKRRGRPPKALAEGTGETAEPKRRGRPPGARGIPTALNEEEAVRLLQERGQARAEGSRLVGLFEE